MNSFTVELVSNASGELFPDKTLSFFYKLHTRAREHGGAMRGCNSGDILPTKVPKVNGAKFQTF